MFENDVRFLERSGNKTNMVNGTRQSEIEESGVISAIWILACNDETSFMAYQSVKYRLGLDESYDIKSLIGRYGELFRLKIPNSALKQWKESMLEGKRRPTYIIRIENTAKREEAINSLTADDGFRSQFRTKTDSPRSDIIINWGLEYIERLRKAKLEGKEVKWKAWKEIWIPSISILASLFIA